MDYEKLHKDTIAKLHQMVNSGKITVKTACSICADFVPESGDERVRKEIIATIHLYYGEPLEDEAKEMIGWLEKQGNLMKALQISNARIGELIEENYYLKEQFEKQGKNNMGISEATKKKLEDSLNEALEKETPESFNEFLDEQGERKPDTDFSDFRTWKYIVDAVLTEKEGIGQYLDSPFTEEVAKKLQKRFGNIEQILANSAKSCKDEQKSDWTEEDMEMSRIIGNAITTNGASIYLKSKGIQVIDAHVWLNELKERAQPQNRWKPSRKQIETLEYYMHTLVCNNYKETLFGLYQDLKKLKGK